MWERIKRAVGLVVLGAAIFLIATMVSFRAHAIDDRLLPPVPEYNYSGKPIKVLIYVFPTREALVAEYNQLTNYQETVYASKLRAFAQVADFGQDHICRIWVVGPTHREDVQWYYWGHELGHCVYGQWHPPLNLVVE
jgi:hypothetical protein